MSTKQSNFFELKNTQHFLELINDPNNDVIVLDFYADWCGPCKKLTRFVEQLFVKEKKYPEVMFAKVNVDKEENNEQVFADLLEKFAVSNIPRLVMFKKAQYREEADLKNPSSETLVDTLNKLVGTN